jgi:hypothetical protein
MMTIHVVDLKEDNQSNIFRFFFFLVVEISEPPVGNEEADCMGKYVTSPEAEGVCLVEHSFLIYAYTHR